MMHPALPGDDHRRHARRGPHTHATPSGGTRAVRSGRRGAAHLHVPHRLHHAGGGAGYRLEPSEGEDRMSTATAPALGANLERGTLRTVLVHRPDLAHERLAPTNCHELLFDDVIWVRRARQEFDAFVDVMRSESTKVLLFHQLLTETLTDAEARAWVLQRRLRPEEVTELFSRELTTWMMEMPAEQL